MLVQWEGLSPDDTSWENWDQLCENYHLEDKVVLQGPTNDTKAGAVNREHKIEVQTQKPRVQIARK